MAEEIPQDFTGLYRLFQGKLQEERNKRLALESEVTALKAQAIKDKKSLLEQFQETMATHAKNFNDKLAALADTVAHDDYGKLEERVYALEHPGKTNNNMR